MVDQLICVLRLIESLLHAAVEQVIEVPQVSVQDCILSRCVLREPQTAEQLVQVHMPYFAQRVISSGQGSAAHRVKCCPRPLFGQVARSELTNRSRTILAQRRKKQ